MKTDHYNLNDEAWFRRQLELVDDIQAPRPVDVTEKVMAQVANRPFMLTKRPSAKIRHRRVASITAACVAAAVVGFIFFPRDSVQAAKSSASTLSQRVLEIYDFCDSYASSTSSTSHSDNFIINFLEY